MPEQTEPKARKGSVGFTGLSRFKGLVTEEYLTQLSGAQKITTYTKMRSDGMIAALYAAMTLPIIAATWTVEPAGKDANAVKARDLVHGQLMERLGTCWEDEVRKLLTYLAYGFAVSTKVWTVERGELVLSELRPLHPKTLLQGGRNWEFDAAGRVVGVWQEGYDGTTWRSEPIPASAMVHLVCNGEFGNPEGASLFRPAYKHWLICDTLYRIQAIGLEKHALGQQVAKYPEGTSPEDQDDLYDFVSGAQAFETGGGTFPIGVEFENVAAEIQTDDLMAAITHHGTRMAQSCLAQFLNLGQEGKGGAYALSQDQTDLFLLSLEAVANYVAAALNRSVVQEIVSYNLATDQFPRLSATITRQTAAQLAAVVRQLTAKIGGSSALTWSEADEDWLREALQLPERTEPRPKPQEVQPAPGQPAQGETQAQSRDGREVIRLADPSGWTEPPTYPELGQIIQELHGQLAEEAAVLRARVWEICRLPAPEEEQGFTRRFARFGLSAEQERALDEAIERFLREVAGSDRTRAGFTGTESEDALLQHYERLGHAVGINRARRLTGAELAALQPTRESPEVVRLLEGAFDRLSEGGRLRLEGQLGEIKELLVAASIDGENPLSVARRLSNRFEQYNRHEFERLARTEMSFATNGGLVDECRAEGVPAMRNLVSPLACDLCQVHAGQVVPIERAVAGGTIAPWHPNCLCSAAPEMEPAS
jgi:hypothetical protein